CYGLVLAMSVLLDVYLLLLSPAYVAFICAFRRSRTVVLRFALASVLAGCALTPFLIAAVGQTHQISWVAPMGHRTIEDLAMQQYFERSPPFAILSALIVATAIALWLFTSARLVAGDRQLLALAGGCLGIQTAALLMLHRPSGSRGVGRVHRRLGRHTMGCGGCRLPSRGCRSTELCFGAT